MENREEKGQTPPESPAKPPASQMPKPPSGPTPKPQGGRREPRRSHERGIRRHDRPHASFGGAGPLDHGQHRRHALLGVLLKFDKIEIVAAVLCGGRLGERGGRAGEYGRARGERKSLLGSGQQNINPELVEFAKVPLVTKSSISTPIYA